jgi:WhiB family redox-sensing transcriptional regulator
VLAWQQIDVSEDPDEYRYEHDPGELIDAASCVADLLRRPAWHREAACRGQGTAAWFPGRGEDQDPAKAICAGCPVTAQCLSAALGTATLFDSGIWGGTSARQRKRRRLAAA